MFHADFVHLHVHTQYSLLDGACRIKELVQKAAQFEMPALAMTDHGNVFGAISFYQTAIHYGVKPIIGCEAYIAPRSRLDKTSPEGRAASSHLVLLAKDEEGYRNLMKLVSAGYLEGFYYKPRMDKEILARHAAGLLATSACLRGEVAWHLRQGNHNAALKAADDYHQIFGKGDFYLELMDHGIPEQKTVNEGLVKIARELNLPLVATNDVHYIEPDQARAHEALLCIQTQTTLSDPNRMRLPTDEFYFKSPEAMKKSFAHIPGAIQNTLAITEKCNLELEFSHYHLPNYAPPGRNDKKAFLEELCQEGLKQRYVRVSPEVTQRLRHELDVIEKMGFVSYFLIVWDFIHFAKQNKIPVGPGRGSAAGSLVSYLLGITDLDPIRYDLLFERFLNPERIGMPDIDIDFCFERRPEVIEYVTNKYGKDNVAQIITFGTMQSRAAVRDVGRVMGVPYGDVDRLAKLIPPDPSVRLSEALDIEAQLKELCENDSRLKDIINTAVVLEGLTRHASIHAAGVVIGDKPLTEYVPLFRSADGQITTGYSMDGIAKMGLLKMDFLGLRTLTVIDQAARIIKKTRGQDVDIEQIPLNDGPTFDLLSKANSFGIFQLESTGMRELLKRYKPSCFEDLISILALYRPGPIGSGMLDDFIRRKRGEVEVRYDHPKLASVLKETYGIIVYQEQVMKIASVLAGFSLTQADHLRRAMSKKIGSVMEQMRKDFVAGCHKISHINEKLANRIFDLIDYFSGYGFNRSHSAAYAMISYRTAYLKANYPVEFMCALLTSEKDNTDKVVEYIKECEAMGIKILPPDVNESQLEFGVVDEKTIRYGLVAVKNIGAAAIESILKQRRSGRYKSLFDLCSRVDTRSVNRKVLESLVKCGAFDSFGLFRSQLMAVLDRAMESGARLQKEKAAGQMSFFDTAARGGDFQEKMEVIPLIKEWPQAEILSHEKALLGFYLSGHPLAHYSVEMKEFTDYSTRDLFKSTDGQAVNMVCLIQSIKLTTTKRTNERMAILRIDDMEGETEAVVFPSVYPTVTRFLQEGAVVVIKGRVSFRDEMPKIIVNEMTFIDEAYKVVKSINIDLSEVNEKTLKIIKKKLLEYPGKIPVYLSLDTHNYKSVQIMVGQELFVNPNQKMIDELKELLGGPRFSLSL